MWKRILNVTDQKRSTQHLANGVLLHITHTIPNRWTFESNTKRVRFPLSNLSSLVRGEMKSCARVFAIFMASRKKTCELRQHHPSNPHLPQLRSSQRIRGRHQRSLARLREPCKRHPHLHGTRPTVVRSKGEEITHSGMRGFPTKDGSSCRISPRRNRQAGLQT